MTQTEADAYLKSAKSVLANTPLNAKNTKDMLEQAKVLALISIAESLASWTHHYLPIAKVP